METIKAVEQTVQKEERSKRIALIDAARGLAVTLMVIHHGLYDMMAFLGAPRWFYKNPVFDVLQVIFIGVFISVSGISSRFSRRNIERGSMVFAIAAVITYVTVRITGTPIWFGILHVLGFYMIFYGFTHKLWDKIPRKAAPFIYIALILLSIYARESFAFKSDIPAVQDILTILGWHQRHIPMNDYQPILPWIFVFLFGTWVGKYIREGSFPKWFYEKKVPFFPLVGRHALIIYVLHQPVLYGITMLVLYLSKT